MIEKMTNQSQDREAVEVWILPECSEGYKIGKGSCVKITVYAENGEMARVPWVCVRFADGKESRFPARYAEITFADKAMSEEVE